MDSCESGLISTPGTRVYESTESSNLSLSTIKTSKYPLFITCFKNTNHSPLVTYY